MNDRARNIAAAPFGGTTDAEPTEQKEEQGTNPGEPNADEAELARRYSLSTEDVQRVRGESWAERCADAERLAQLSDSQSIRDRARRHLQAMQDKPNKGELAALTGHAERKAQATARLIGVGSEEPEKDEEGPPGFDGGAREPAPAPPDPKADHDALVVEYLRTLPPAGGGDGW